MSKVIRHYYCKSCERDTKFEREYMSTTVGCIVAFLTGGVFLPIWLLLGLIQSFHPYRCADCGWKRGSNKSFNRKLKTENNPKAPPRMSGGGNV